MFIRARESMVRNTRGQTMTEYAPDRRLTVPQIGTGSSNFISLRQRVLDAEKFCLTSAKSARVRAQTIMACSGA